jgi:hypothetical protein
MQCPLCLTKTWNGKKRILMTCTLWLFHIMDIAESNKSIFLPDVCNQHRYRRHGDGAERVSKHVFCEVLWHIYMYKGCCEFLKKCRWIIWTYCRICFLCGVKKLLSNDVVKKLLSNDVIIRQWPKSLSMSLFWQAFMPVFNTYITVMFSSLVFQWILRSCGMWCPVVW